MKYFHQMILLIAFLATSTLTIDAPIDLAVVATDALAQEVTEEFEFSVVGFNKRDL